MSAVVTLAQIRRIAAVADDEGIGDEFAVEVGDVQQADVARLTDGEDAELDRILVLRRAPAGTFMFALDEEGNRVG